MLQFLLIWALCSVSTQRALCWVPRGSSLRSERTAGTSVSGALSLRKLLQEPLLDEGKDAPEGRFPYACSLRTIGSQIHQCAGTLIDPEWVLTAAHCVTGEDSLGPTPLVYVGAHEIDDESSAEVIMAAEVIIHESYKGGVMGGFDIALVRLKVPSTRQPMPIAKREQPIGVGEVLATVGWGKINEGGKLPSVLQLGDQVEYVGNKKCRRSWPNLKDEMLCAFSGAEGACKGDSGGLLLIPDSAGGDSIKDGDPGFDLLVGLVSFGPSECGSSKKPGVYTRVSSFREWIDEKISTPTPETEPAASSNTTTTIPATPPSKGCGDDCEEVNLMLYDAADSGDDVAVKAALRDGADVSSRHGEANFTALCAAAENGHLVIVEMLLEAGADIEARSRNEGTPLIKASSGNYPDIVEYLIKEGADIDAQNAQGVTGLVFAAQNGHLDVARALVKAGAAVDLKTDRGIAPLGMAAFHGRIAMLGLLLKAGADVNSTDLNGQSALYVAAQEGNRNVVEALVKAGAAVDQKSIREDTPLRAAALNIERDVVVYLLESGADVTLVNERGGTALMAAAIGGDPIIVRLMLTNGADKDAQDFGGVTALSYAAFYGNAAVVDVLVSAGADRDIENEGGSKPVDVICGCLGLERRSAVCGDEKCGPEERAKLQEILEG